jgi:hypothetical protein
VGSSHPEADVGIGGSLAMTLPDRVAALVRDGMELGHAMDHITGGATRSWDGCRRHPHRRAGRPAACAGHS